MSRGLRKVRCTQIKVDTTIDDILKEETWINRLDDSSGGSQSPEQLPSHLELTSADSTSMEIDSSLMLVTPSHISSLHDKVPFDHSSSQDKNTLSFSKLPPNSYITATQSAHRTPTNFDVAVSDIDIKYFVLMIFR